MRSKVFNSCSLYVNYSESPFKNQIFDDFLAKNWHSEYVLSLAWDWTEAFSHLCWCFQHKSVTGPSRAALKVTARLSLQHLSEGIDWFFSKLHQSNLIKSYVLLGDVQLFFSWRLWSISRELLDLFAHCFSSHIEQNVGLLELSVERAVPWAVCRRGDGDGGFICPPLCRVCITVHE